MDEQDTPAGWGYVWDENTRAFVCPICACLVYSDLVERQKDTGEIEGWRKHIEFHIGVHVEGWGER